MVRPLTVAVVLVTALVVGVPALATTASACGFNEEFVDAGIVNVHMKCTRPIVDVHPDKDPQVPDV